MPVLVWVNYINNFCGIQNFSLTHEVLQHNLSLLHRSYLEHRMHLEQNCEAAVKTEDILGNWEAFLYSLESKPSK